MTAHKTHTGLSSDEVAARVQDGKVNRFRDDGSTSLWQILLRNLVDLPNAIIFTSVAFLLIYQQYEDAILISGIILLNNVVSIIQEIQARNQLRKVTLMNKEPVAVRRDGADVMVNPEDLVVDDVIGLQVSKSVYVDGELLSAEGVLVDESALTGESDYVQKRPGDALLSGTIVITGTGYYRATKVGAESFSNKVTKEVRRFVNYLSPLQADINRVVQLLTIVTIATVAFLLLLNLTSLELDRIELLRNIISIVSSMVPQGILLTLTLAFMLGVLRMYRRGILVQRASAVETLAGVRVLGMDKTGTLTQNELKLTATTTLGIYDQKDPILKSGANLGQLLDWYTTTSQEQNKTLLAIAAGLDGKIDTKATGDWQLQGQVPFTSRNKYSAIAFSHAGEEYLVLLGSPEILAPLLSGPVQSEVQKREIEFAERGWRNLLLVIGTRKSLAGKGEFEIPATLGELAAKDGYQFQGLAVLSLEDKLREGAREIINQFVEIGVKPLIISGDGAATLMALLRQLQIEVFNTPISGPELAAFTSQIQREEAILGHDVFARVTPEQKVEILKVYQSKLGRVAMIGDGINDAMAIKTANLGIAMGGGASVTRNIADVILLDDDLRKLAEVIREGREILFNTLRSAMLLLVKNYYSLLAIVFTLTFLLPFPFSPRSLMLLAFFNATLPVLLILADRNPKLAEFNFIDELKEFVLKAGSWTALITIGIIVYFGKISPLPLAEYQTFIYLFLVGTGIINSLIMLNKSYRPWRVLAGSWASLVGLLTFGLVLAGMFFKPVAEFTDVVVLSWPMIGLAVALILSYMLLTTASYGFRRNLLKPKVF